MAKKHSLLSIGILVFFFYYCCCWETVVVMAESDSESKSQNMAAYKDPKQPLNVRIKDLMSRMTLAEKIGQMTQIDRTVASREVLKKYNIGMYYKKKKSTIVFLISFTVGFLMNKKKHRECIERWWQCSCKTSISRNMG